jgi:hypothetical protein
MNKDGLSRLFCTLKQMLVSVQQEQQPGRKQQPGQKQQQVQQRQVQQRERRQVQQVFDRKRSEQEPTGQQQEQRVSLKFPREIS